MQALIRIKVSELDLAFIEKIKALFNDEVIEIGIDTERPIRASDDMNKLNQAIENVERGQNLVAFTSEELEQLAQKLTAL